MVRENNILIHDAEQNILGVTHAEVGAYLMGLWGLPEPIVEAIAFHHKPSAKDDIFQPLTAVYAANVLERRSFVINPEYTVPEFDMEYLDTLSLTDKVEDWEEMALEKGRSHNKENNDS